MATDVVTDLLFAFAELSQRLLEIGVKTRSLKVLPGGYGSWEIVAQKGVEAIKCEFDGKDSVLYVQVSPVRPNLVPNEWSRLEEKAFPQRKKSEIAYTELFMKSRFSDISN